MRSLHFFKGLSWLIILNLLVKPVWIFFIDRQVQNIVGLEEYGKYFALLSLSYVLFFIADAGLSNMMNQQVAGNSTANMKQLFRIKFFLLLLYIAVFCFVGWVAGLERWDTLIYIVLIQAFTSLFLFFRSMLTANQYFTVDAGFSVIDKFLMILICGSFLYASFFGNISLVLFLQIQLGCTVFSVIAVSLFAFRKQLLLAGEKENIKLILKRTLPFALIIFLMSLHYRIDGFLLERIHPDGAMEAGIYASAYRLLDAGNMVGYLAASFLVPFIARNQKEKKLIGEVIINTRHALLFFGIAMASFIIMSASWVQQLLYHSNDNYNSVVIQLCIATLPAYFLVHIYGSVLTATSRFRMFITILLLSTAMNITLNLILIPIYGALGCCIAALTSQYFCSLVLLIKTSKAFSLSLANRSALVYLLSAGILLVLFYIGKTAFINVWLVLAMAVCITLGLLTTQLSFTKKYFSLR